MIHALLLRRHSGRLRQLSSKLRIRAWPPSVFMLIDVVWLVLLGLTAFGLAAKWKFLTDIRDPFAGVVPFVVPWPVPWAV